MAKRQYLAEEAEEPISNTSSSKRARTADSDEEEAPTQTRTRSKRDKGKANGRERVEDSDGEQEQDAEEDEMDIRQQHPALDDDEQYEAMFGAQIRAHLENKRKVQGGVAEAGIIEYVEMHQFMCHKFLRFSFGPQINFIIGHNGSGKSAVLSAITVALGGKTASTGRGNGLKSFIREGQSAAEVTIHIKNQGEEAFKPNEYGATIVITRKFTKEGSSDWKMKNKEGKIVSKRKDELSAICDHMNIQVDNPMNVLTQDAARQFLSASVPQDKYKFFLRGTQLTQLSDEYDTCLANITQTQKTLAAKKEALPDLKAKLRDVTARYDEAAKAREQKQKAVDLKYELAWSHVAAKEEELTKKVEEAAKLARRLPKIEDNLQEAQVAFDLASEEVRKLEEAYLESGDIDDLAKKKSEIQDKLKGNKSRVQAVMQDIKQMNQSMNAIRSQIDDLDRQMQEEQRKMAQHSQAKQQETQRKIEEAKAAVSDREHRLSEVQTSRRDLGLQADRIKESGMGFENQKKTLQEQIQNCDRMISSAKERENDALVPYGRNIKQVLERIKAMRWRGDPPLGPLGQYVKARDPRTWGEILRNQLGSYLCAFALTNAQDRDQLKNLLRETGNGNIIILIYEKDLFDFSHGEPPQHMLTVLRALDISDPYVLRLLINQAHIEGQILAPTRREAEDALRTLPRGGSAWSADKFNVRVFPEGGVSSSPLNMRRQNDASNLLLTGRDTASNIRHFAEEKQRHEAEYLALNKQTDGMKAEHFTLRRDIDKFTTEENRLNREIATAKRMRDQLIQAANEDLPAGIAGFEGAKEEAEREKENVAVQFAEAQRQKNELDAVQRGYLEEMNAIKSQLAEYEEKRISKNKLIDAAVEVRLNAQNKIKYYEDKHKAEKAKVDTAEAASAVLQEEFESWTETATKISPQKVLNPRKAAEVQRHLDVVVNALKEREKRHGASVEEMAKEVTKAKEHFDKADRELKDMTKLTRTLKQSLLVRFARWQEFRRHIALRCKHVFQFHLSHRGYYGKILFNHDAGTLTLRVQTDDQLQTQGAKDKDPRSLSGGEKSFSTICLLLSLWESIGCPLRCLDEFDVFMDAVNRRISMKMMIDTANTSDRKQYILITPQDMTNVAFGPTVKVLRMSDPERGNGMLPFAASNA